MTTMNEQDKERFKRLQDKLQKIYGGQSKDRDIWGRREASPKEISEALEPKLTEDTVDGYYPSNEVVRIKEEGL